MGERSKTRKRSNRVRATGKPRKRPRKRAQQLGLVHAYRGRGGPRPGAGRKPRAGRRPVPHRRRTGVRRDRPQHVTLRVRQALPSLRRRDVFGVIRAAIGDSHKPNFRIVHFSVLSNHVHLVTEADSRQALGRGIQGLKIRMTKRLNKILGSRGTIFTERYHDREVSTPREARALLLYVVGNYRKHSAEAGRTLPARWVDPCSSARQLDGWNQPVRREPGVVQPPRTWLLAKGWKRHGLLDAHAIPSRLAR